ncbi:MAG TPA: imidazole glycerol phosphate synthase subunit HisH [Burkholderiales bacterium]|nr:imidazole glycerol phosphate synthase subunit HisH [Burkholderiales bacterium]
MIAIVKYGLGNVDAIANIYDRLDVAASLASTADDIRAADRIILPGVGSFDHAMERLDQSGMRDALDEAVLRARKPVLGICVGMQMMAARSEEGIRPGLGWIDGEVRRFDFSGLTEKPRLPHMGWNDVTPGADEGLFNGLHSDARFYFLHSYYFDALASAEVLAVTDYYGGFACSVGRGNIFGVQFHPEKSHGWGIRLLQNFAEM